MSVRVYYQGVSDLASDLRKIAVQAPKEMRKPPVTAARAGGMQARRNARKTARRHGKHYPSAITWDRKAYGAFGLYAAEYGPDSSRPQGGMSFEEGSRNQPPHRDLAKAAGMARGILVNETRQIPKRLFWPS